MAVFKGKPHYTIDEKKGLPSISPASYLMFKIIGKRSHEMKAECQCHNFE